MIIIEFSAAKDFLAFHRYASKTKTSPKINEKTQKSYSFFISIRQITSGEDRTRTIFPFILFEQNTKKEETKASLPYSQTSNKIISNTNEKQRFLFVNFLY